MNDVDRQLTDHEARIAILENDVTDLKHVTEEIHSLAISMERLSTNQSIMLEQQKQIKKDVDEIKLQPAKDAHEAKMTVVKEVIKYVVVALLAALIAWLARGGVQ